MPDDISSDRMMLDTLTELAQTLRDCEHGYRSSADDATDVQLKSVLNGLARTRAEQADELDHHVKRAGGQPASPGGSTTGRLHRYFVDLKSALVGNDRAAILDEVVRGESYAEAAFDKAKKQALSGEVRSLIQRQHDSVKASRDRFRAMKQDEGGDSSGGLFDRASQTVSRLGKSLYRQAPGSIDGVAGYVAERPMTATLMAMGIGFALGALVTSLGRSASESATHRPQ